MPVDGPQEGRRVRRRQTNRRPTARGQQYPPPSYLPPQAPRTRSPRTTPDPARGPAPGIAYAGFWIRLLAILIDEIILFVPLMVIFIATNGPALTTTRDCVQNGTVMSLCEHVPRAPSARSS